MRVFVSASREDAALVAAFDTHLSALKRQREIEVWHDGLLVAGESRDDEIARRLAAADLVLLLVSPDLLSSDTLFHAQIEQAMERHAAGAARVVPVLLRPVDWSGLSFSRLQPAPRNGVPITTWQNRDDAWLQVVECVRDVVADLAGREAGLKVRVSVTTGPDPARSFTLAARDRIVVGRSPEATFCVRDPGLSRNHFLVELDPPSVLVRDLGSSNGTFLNHEVERVRAAVVRSGDAIRAGGSVFTVEVIEPPPEPATVPLGAQPTALPTLDHDAEPGVAVRCLRCGNKAPGEAPHPRAEKVAYFCEECRTAIVAAPLLPAGYQIGREIGRGSMGAVYLARHQALGVERAIKVILPLAAMTERARRLFLREASEQARLRHPRIVEVHELSEVKPGVFCMVMRYVDGPTAEALLRRGPAPSLAPDLAVAIAAGALEGLDHAHRHGVVHRDVKDANILVAGRAPHLDVQLADFGLAKAYETSGASGFTRTGEIGGTLLYMSPEHILDFRCVRPPADLYSMGVTLYRLLTGAFPIEIPPGGEPLTAILEAPIVPVRARAPAIPEALAAAVERALAKRPEERFASAAAMRAALVAASR